MFPEPWPAARVKEQYGNVPAGKGYFFPTRMATYIGETLPGDGLMYTLFFADAAEAVPWTKPDELVYAADQPLPKLGGVHDDGFFGVSALGSIVFVPKGTDEKTVRALITSDANDPIAEDLKKQLTIEIAQSAPPRKRGPFDKP